MYRLVAYTIACIVTAGLLAILVLDKSGSVFLAMTVASWVAAAFVTWRVAQRERRRPWLWVALALAIGPFAWILMAAQQSPRADSA